MSNNPLSKQFTTLSLLKFAFPNIIMMIFLSLYSIVDGMFISRYVGTLALSALNMSWPLSCVELGISIMLATGGSAIVARKLGEKRNEEARKYFSFILYISLVLSVVINIFCVIFLKPILVLLGTSAAQMPDCYIYTLIILLFSPAMFLQNLFQTFFITAGKPGLGLGVTVAGGVANIVFDYLFLGPMGMGIEGAAIATGIGYSIPAVVGMIYFTFFRKGSIYLVPCKFYWNILKHACGNGSSEMVTNVANGITTFLFNIIFMMYWAEDGVAAITIILYFQFVFSSAFFGFSMGVAPVISYKYGAQDLKQLHHIVTVCLGFIITCSIGMYALSLVTIDGMLSIFTDPAGHVFKISIDGFPIFAVSFIFMGLNIFASSMFTALSNGAVSAVISFARTFVFLVGCLILLPMLLGHIGIWLAVPVAEGLGQIISIGFLLWGRKKYHY